MRARRSAFASAKHAHTYFTNWDTYGGLALEVNWRNWERYLCDLCFRSLLIRYGGKTRSTGKPGRDRFLNGRES